MIAIFSPCFFVQCLRARENCVRPPNEGKTHAHNASIFPTSFPRVFGGKMRELEIEVDVWFSLFSSLVLNEKL